MTGEPYTHVIGVFTLSQSAPEKHNQEKQAHIPLRASWISQYMSDMFDNQSCYSTIE